MQAQAKRAWIFSLLLVLSALGVYGQFLWNPIVFDDLPFFSPVTDLLDRFSHSFSLFESRWLPYATIAWSKRLLGIDLIWFRLEALILHALVGVSLFIFLRQLYRQVLANSTDEAAEQPWLTGAFIAALFFVVHPVAVYGAGYLIQRTIVMATLFSLLALIAYLKGLEQENRFWLWGSVACYLLAVLSKESAIMLPAVMWALTILIAGTGKAVLHRLWPVYLACFMIAVFVLLQNAGMIGTAYEIEASRMLELAAGQHSSNTTGTGVAGSGQLYHLLSVLTQCALFFKYLGLWLLPDPDWMSVDMREPFAAGLFSPYWIAALGFIAYGGLAIRFLMMRGRRGLLGLAMLFPWVLFFTEFSVVRIQESFVLYRSYLWMPGIFIALPLLTMQFKPRVAIFSGTVLALLLAMVAVERLTTFSHPLLLWDDAEKLVHNRHDLPGVDRIYGNRANYFDDMKRYQDALADYQTALSLRPNYAHYYLGLAITYSHLGEYGKAMVAYDQSIALDPTRVRAYYWRGMTYEEMGNKIAALADYVKSCDLGWQSGCNKVQQMKGEKSSAAYLPLKEL